MATTNWQRQDVSEHYLVQVRGGIPFEAEQVRMMLQVVHHFVPNPKKIIEKLYHELFIDHFSIYNQRDRQAVAKEYYERPDKADNILERGDIQVNWLREIGFRHSDCYFKWMELAVFEGVK